MPGSAASNRATRSSHAGPKVSGSVVHWLGPAMVMVTWSPPPAPSSLPPHPLRTSATVAAHAPARTAVLIADVMSQAPVEDVKVDRVGHRRVTGSVGMGAVSVEVGTNVTRVVGVVHHRVEVDHGVVHGVRPDPGVDREPS